MLGRPVQNSTTHSQTSGTKAAPTEPATAIWYEAGASVRLREEPVAPKGGTDVTVRALHSAVSRGTERLVLEGKVPRSENERMRGPFQAGDFPHPVKYGYAVVGVVEDGPHAGRRVFALHPHQSRFCVPADSLVPVPDGVPSRRATLAANLETAMTVVWDSEVSLGDRVCVIGAGVVGCLIARLVAQIPATEVTLCDVDARKAAVAAAMGAEFAVPDALEPGAFDVAINASARGEGLATALAALGREGRAVEASWLGTQCAALPLGGAFHSQRLTIRSSQVGSIPPHRAPRWSHGRRMARALALAADEALDALLTHEVALADAPERLPDLLLHEPSALAITIRYPGADGPG